jgi:hypothetical protein
LNVFWGSFMALLCSSRWSDQKCCKTECVALKTSFKQDQCKLFKPIFLQDTDFYSKGRSFLFFTKISKSLKIFHGRTMAMAAMNIVSAWGFSVGKLSLRRCPQGSPLYFVRKPPSLGPNDQS